MTSIRLLVDHSPITLKLDTTLVRLALFDHNVSVLGVSSECYKCNLQSLWPPCSVAAASPQFTVNTDYPVHLQVHLSNGSVLPRETIKFISQGEYTLIVDNDAFSLYLDHGDADAFWKPPVVALISIIGLIALSITIAKIAPRIPLISSMFHKKEASLLSEVERQVQVLLWSFIACSKDLVCIRAQNQAACGGPRCLPRIYADLDGLC